MLHTCCYFQVQFRNPYRKWAFTDRYSINVLANYYVHLFNVTSTHGWYPIHQQLSFFIIIYNLSTQHHYYISEIWYYFILNIWLLTLSQHVKIYLQVSSTCMLLNKFLTVNELWNLSRTGWIGCNQHIIFYLFWKSSVTDIMFSQFCFLFYAPFQNFSLIWRRECLQTLTCSWPLSIEGF